MDQVTTSLCDIEAKIVHLIDFLSFGQVWDGITSFSNSSFTTSLVGALAGAFAGAWAAQRIAERSKLREELTKEIRNINAGMTVALAVASSSVGLKKQYLKSIRENYSNDRKKLINAIEKKRERPSENGEAFKFTGDLRTLSELSPPVEFLKEIIFSRLSVTERPLSLASAISESLDNLNYSICARNSLIETFKNGDFPLGADINSMYFGLPYGGGHVNQAFGDCIEGMAMHNDDVIFFTVLLCSDLHSYGVRVATRFEKELKSTPPTVNEIVFDGPRNEGLIPDDEDYPTWFSGFQQRQETSKKSWRSLFKNLTFRKKFDKKPIN